MVEARLKEMLNPRQDGPVSTDEDRKRNTFQTHTPEIVMSRKACMNCGNRKKFFAHNYAGFDLRHSSKSHAFPRRIMPSRLPGNSRREYLCEDCANAMTIECTDHGALRGTPFENGQLLLTCNECEQERERFGSPPNGYDSIEAVECPTPFQSGLLRANPVVDRYLASHPCQCGGKWELVVGNSPYESGIADNGYQCQSCGKKKWFRFRLWTTGASFPKPF